MRPFLLAALVVAFAVPASAQISFIPMVGYDLDRSDPMIGLGFEYALPAGTLPLTAALRPSVHYVFAGSDVTVVRVPIEAIGRFSAPSLPVSPYGKAGLVVEYTSVDFGGASASNTEVGLALGAGAELNRILGEVTLGIGNVSSAQLTVGYRF